MCVRRQPSRIRFLLDGDICICNFFYFRGVLVRLLTVPWRACKAVSLGCYHKQLMASILIVRILSAVEQLICEGSDLWDFIIILSNCFGFKYKRYKTYQRNINLISHFYLDFS